MCVEKLDDTQLLNCCKNYTFLDDSETIKVTEHAQLLAVGLPQLIKHRTERLSQPFSHPRAIYPFSNGSFAILDISQGINIVNNGEISQCRIPVPRPLIHIPIPDHMRMTIHHNITYPGRLNYFIFDNDNECKTHYDNKPLCVNLLNMTADLKDIKACMDMISQLEEITSFNNCGILTSGFALIIPCGHDNELEQYDLTTMTLVKKICFEHPINAWTISLDGSWCVLYFDSKTLRLYDIKNQTLSSLESKDEHGYKNMLLSRCSTLLATLSNNDELAIWHIKTGKILFKQSNIATCAFSPFEDVIFWIPKVGIFIQNMEKVDYSMLFAPSTSKLIVKKVVMQARGKLPEDVKKIARKLDPSLDALIQQVKEINQSSCTIS